MKAAHAFLAVLTARIPAATNHRLVLVDGFLAVEFSMGDRGSRYGLAPEDLERPVLDLVDEIVAHHEAHSADPARMSVDNIARDS